MQAKGTGRSKCFGGGESSIDGAHQSQDFRLQKKYDIRQMIDFKRGVTGDSVWKHYTYFAGNSSAYSIKN